MNFKKQKNKKKKKKKKKKEKRENISDVGFFSSVSTMAFCHLRSVLLSINNLWCFFTDFPFVRKIFDPGRIVLEILLGTILVLSIKIFFAIFTAMSVLLEWRWSQLTMYFWRHSSLTIKEYNYHSKIKTFTKIVIC